MNREKAIKIYDELKTKCPGLILAGSVLIADKNKNIHDLDLIWVGKIFPLHKLPLKDMDKMPFMKSPKILQFTYRGEIIDIHSTDEKNLPSLISQLSGHHIKMKQR
ncbi:MAG: hypothetical protein Q8O88_03595 [bacterium]|nr:hypothetical protein [bacterium]